MQVPIQIPESITLQIRENSRVCMYVCMYDVCRHIRTTRSLCKQSQSNCEEMQSTLFSLILGLGSILLINSSGFLTKTPSCFYNSSYSNMFILRTHSYLSFKQNKRFSQSLNIKPQFKPKEKVSFKRLISMDQQLLLYQ